MSTRFPGRLFLDRQREKSIASTYRARTSFVENAKSIVFYILFVNFFSFFLFFFEISHVLQCFLLNMFMTFWFMERREIDLSPTPRRKGGSIGPAQISTGGGIKSTLLSFSRHSKIIIELTFLSGAYNKFPCGRRLLPRPVFTTRRR